MTEFHVPCKRRRATSIVVNFLLVLLLSSTVVNALRVPTVVDPSTITRIRRHHQRRAKLGRLSTNNDASTLLMSTDGDPNPVFPTAFRQGPITPPPISSSSWQHPSSSSSSSPNEVDQSSGRQEKQREGQANTRFSKFAPEDSEDLSPNEFRAKLKENMKADLEERRRKDPTRGNQPAKSYLDSL